MKTKKRHKISLKFGLIFIVILCWLLPVVLIIGAIAIYVNVDVRNHLNYRAIESTQNAALTTETSILAAVGASKNASYDPTIKTAYQHYQKNRDPTYLYNKVITFLSLQYGYDEKFLSTILFFTEQPEILYHVSNRAKAMSYTEILEYKERVHLPIQEIVKDLNTDITFFKDDKTNNTYMVRNILNSDFQSYAVIVLQLNVDHIFSNFEGVAWGTGATVYLNGTPIVIVPEEDGNGISVEGYDMELSYNEPEVLDFDGDMIISGGNKVEGVDISYLMQIDRKGYIREMFGFADILKFFVVLLIPLMALVILFFYQHIFLPIRRLTDVVGIIEGGNLGFQLEESVGNIEFDYLTQAFNKMSVKLKQQFERIYNEELALREARIMALQSQINPHFLNNTLEIINWEARFNNNYKVSRMIESLSIMLDAAMDRKSAPVVSLSQEIMYVDAYLYIISERFGKRLIVQKQIEDAVLQYDVPRLILQPIIENAVEHGVAIHQSGIIILSAAKMENRLILSIDNNCPMTEDDKASVKRLLNPDHDKKSTDSLQLGIYNVNIRLKMIYGETAGLAINMKDNHTISTITIPLKQ